MSRAINTGFDQDIDLDVALELIDGKQPAVQTTLKNAENVYKSFLYLKKLYSTFPSSRNILGMNTINNATLAQVITPELTNIITVNNISNANTIVSINGGQYTMTPGEKVDFPIIAPDTTSSPVIAGDTVLVQGNVSYMHMNIQG